VVVAVPRAGSSFWVVLRFARAIRHEITVTVDRSYHDPDTPLGVDRMSRDRRCVAVEFDPPQPALADASPGTHVVVRVRGYRGLDRSAPTRIRLAVTHDFDAAPDAWLFALGCAGEG
jgi:hypothetical protein